MTPREFDALVGAMADAADDIADRVKALADDIKTLTAEMETLRAVVEEGFRKTCRDALK